MIAQLALLAKLSGLGTDAIRFLVCVVAGALPGFIYAVDEGANLE